MKKIIFLVTLLIFFTGCTVKNIEDLKKEDVVTEALNNKENAANVAFSGYKFYLPRGTSIVDKREYNSKLLYKGDYYYLYVDIVSYHYNKDFDYDFSNKPYFVKEFVKGGKNGFVEIIEEKDLYHLIAYYNHAKIEAYVSEKNLNYSVYNSIRLLSSIVYNDIIIDNLIGETLDYQEEEYNFFESKREDGDFLDYIEEYDYKTEDKVKDEDVLE